jgi:uncharacterized phage protein (TIGR02220 family)
MAKLGYTWYPKDWGNSENVFELNLSERGMYRELIDLAMLNDNNTEIKESIWCRKFAINISDLKIILERLSCLGLIVIDKEILFIPSCESRLNLGRGGKKSKPTKESITNLNKKEKEPVSEPMSEPISEPMSEQIESKVNIINKYLSQPKVESIDWDGLLNQFKELTKRNFKLIPKKAKDQLNARLKEGYTKKDIWNAILNCYNDDYHKENNHKYLTLEFISRPDKMEKYSSDVAKPKSKQ